MCLSRSRNFCRNVSTRKRLSAKPYSKNFKLCRGVGPSSPVSSGPSPYAPLDGRSSLGVPRSGTGMGSSHPVVIRGLRSSSFPYAFQVVI